MEDGEENGGDFGLEDVGRSSGKHSRSKDRNRKEKREEKDHGSRREREEEPDRKERRKVDGREEKDREREKEDSDRKERRKGDDREEKDREREKERSRDKTREKGHDKDGKVGVDREKEGEREREPNSEMERSYDREHERSKEKGKDRGREQDRDRDVERDRTSEKLEHDRGKSVRERMTMEGIERERGITSGERCGRGITRRSGGGRKILKEGSTGTGRGRSETETRSGEREKDRIKDRERDKEKEKERIDKGKEKLKDRDKEKRLETDRDRSRTRDRERVGDEGDRLKIEGKESRNSLEQVKAIEGENRDIHARDASKDHEQNLAFQQLSTSEIEERITKMKQERLKKKPSGESEILSWVNKSRKLEDKRTIEKQKASRLMKALEEQDNINEESEEEEGAAGLVGKHLAGVKILHGLDKVLEGGTVVLTLKDQSILANGDVNEDIDMLENVEIGEQKRRNEAYKAAKKGAGVYDDKFSEEALSEKKMLPQYDEPNQDEGVTLDDSGRFTGEAEKKLEELRRRIQGNVVSKNYEDLTTYGKTSSDYFTPEEMLQFKKPKRKKSLRKKEKLDLDALEADAKSVGLGASDLGSRKDQIRSSSKLEQERAEAQMRSEAYESALARAQEASMALARAETLTIVKAEEDDGPVFGEDYEDLQRSLERARKLALSRQEEAAASGPQAIALEVKSKTVEIENRTSTEPQENKVVITEMEEFVLGLQFNEDTHKPDSEDVFMDEEQEEKELKDHVEDVGDEASAWSELMETDVAEPSISKEEEDVVPDEVIHEVVLLQDRGTLKETIDWGGRTMDKKKSKLVGLVDNDGSGSKEIRIERLDEFGRIMTPKEAFRMLSHKFHGKGPQYQEDLKLKQMKASDTPSMSVERMREAQARLKTPYLVLSGHVKPGQTSDPRSGFATVEKDTLGSLTPMLGDRKVEHFLGIKRKDDSGGMGPPPPKKSKS
ncbi:unnamed protein product [Spirodela intermedia]|uniref:Uncharacterized protein n=1 Tax=Spirodela intermedia TaxID=51605 RepID=A0A7I8IL91_SPIIN|nr:unnamed protein product [Spirodela intermedia]CAA6657942.1 unnamed protein product [Spirodela intermedia]